MLNVYFKLFEPPQRPSLSVGASGHFRALPYCEGTNAVPIGGN